jgi:hypothetical protein
MNGKAELLLGTMGVHCLAVNIDVFSISLFLEWGENECTWYVCH